MNFNYLALYSLALFLFSWILLPSFNRTYLRGRLIPSLIMLGYLYNIYKLTENAFYCVLTAAVVTLADYMSVKKGRYEF